METSFYPPIEYWFFATGKKALPKAGGHRVNPHLSHEILKSYCGTKQGVDHATFATITQVFCVVNITPVEICCFLLSFTLLGFVTLRQNSPFYIISISPVALSNILF